MTIQYINTGSSPNAGDGDTLRTAFNKINYNFQQVSTGSVGAALVQGTSPPVNANTGTFWYDVITGRLYVYYDNTWVDSNPDINIGGSGGGGGSSLSVGLIDSFTNSTTNTVTNISTVLFDTQSAFTVNEFGVGTVVVGMNSTFKYIDIAGQPGLTAVGLDTLTFVAGAGIVYTTDPTPGHQKITIATTSTLPIATTSSFLFNSGTGTLSWQQIHLNQLVNGSRTLTLNPDGSITFPDGSTQTTAFSSIGTISVLHNMTATFSLLPNGNVVYNDGTAQVTAYPGTRIGSAINIGTTSSNIFIPNTNYQALGLINSLAGVYIEAGTPQKTWQFNTSGWITFPDVSIQKTAYTGTFVVNDPAPRLGGILRLNSNQLYDGPSDANQFNLLAGVNLTSLYAIGGPTGGINLNTGVANTATNIWNFGYTGMLTLPPVNTGTTGIVYPDNTIQTTAWTGTVAYSHVTGIPPITYSSTSTLNNGSYVVSLSSTGVVTMPSTLNLQYTTGTNELTVFAASSTGGIKSDVANNSITVQTTSSSRAYTWLFNSNGSITWPDGSVQASATTASLAASSLTNSIYYGTWTFQVLSNGNIEYPDGTIQTTAFTGTATYANSATNLINGSYALRPVAVPSNVAYGSPGDQIGDIAFDGNYIYYCYLTYTTTTYQITSVDQTTSGTYYIDVLQQGGLPTPQVGWTFQDPVGGPVQVITNVQSGIFGTTPYWRLYENGYLNYYTTGSTFTLVNTTVHTPHWLTAPTSTNSIVTKSSAFINQGLSVTLGNITAQLISNGGNQLKVTSVSGTYAATYNWTTDFNGSVGSTQVSSVTLTTAGITLPGISNQVGDVGTLILMITNVAAYRITFMTGASYQNNMLTIEQLI